MNEDQLVIALAKLEVVKFAAGILFALVVYSVAWRVMKRREEGRK